MAEPKSNIAAFLSMDVANTVPINDPRIGVA